MVKKLLLGILLGAATLQASEEVSVIDRLIQALERNEKLERLPRLCACQIKDLDAATGEKIESLNQAFIKKYCLDCDEHGFISFQDNYHFYDTYMMTLTGQVFLSLSTWTLQEKSKRNLLK